MLFSIKLDFGRQYMLHSAVQADHDQLLPNSCLQLNYVGFHSRAYPILGYTAPALGVSGNLLF